MGFSISWVAFRGLDKAEVSRRTGLQGMGSTSAEPPTREAPFAFCAFETGWSAVFAADYTYASVAALARLSAGAEVLGCRIEEHMMFSAAALFADGASVWQVVHDSQKGRYDLEASGRFPLAYERIRDGLLDEQARSPGGFFSTDFVWDIPVTLAQALTGYRHDLWKVAWGVPIYERLVVGRAE